METNPPNEPDIKLPGDRKVELFVLAQCVDLVIHRIFTKKSFEAEVLKADVNSLSRLSRDTEASYYRRLEADQGLFADIDQVPGRKIHLRPPNWVVLFVVMFGTLALVTYGQSSPVISSQFFYIINFYGADIAVGILLIILLAFFLRRKRKAKV